MSDRDRTAMTEPLTTGQQIVAWWETSTSASEPADLAEKIDDALELADKNYVRVVKESERLRAALREIEGLLQGDNCGEFTLAAWVRAQEALNGK